MVFSQIYSNSNRLSDKPTYKLETNGLTVVQIMLNLRTLQTFLIFTKEGRGLTVYDILRLKFYTSFSPTELFEEGLSLNFMKEYP